MKWVKKLSIPDWLSLSRIFAVPLLVYLMLAEERLLFSILLTIAFITDALDGFIARKFNMQTEYGPRLDSTADAILFTMAIFAAFYFEAAFIFGHIQLVALALGVYLLQLILGLIKFGKPTSFHTYLAKTAAVLQSVFLLLLFYYQPILWLFYIAAFISIIETIEEIILIMILKDYRSNVRGLYWVMKGKSSI